MILGNSWWAVNIIAGSKNCYFKDSSVWAKSIFVGFIARGFPAKKDVVNEIIEPDLRRRRLGFSSLKAMGGCSTLLLSTFELKHVARYIASTMQV